VPVVVEQITGVVRHSTSSAPHWQDGETEDADALLVRNATNRLKPLRVNNRAHR